MKNLHDCECLSGYKYDDSTHECVIICHESCWLCDDLTFYNCDECSVGNFHWGQGICRSYCPTGYTENSDTKTCDPIDDYVTPCLTFDRIAYDWSTTSGITAVGGATPGNSPENDDPLPIMDRGIWFDGVDDYLTLSGLTLGHTFTLILWVRVYAPGGTIFSVSRNI